MENRGDLKKGFLNDVLDPTFDDYEDELYKTIYSSDGLYTFDYMLRDDKESLRTKVQEEIIKGNEAYIKEILDICVERHWINEYELSYILGEADEYENEIAPEKITSFLNSFEGMKEDCIKKEVQLQLRNNMNPYERDELVKIIKILENRRELEKDFVEDVLDPTYRDYDAGTVFRTIYSSDGLYSFDYMLHYDKELLRIRTEKEIEKGNENYIREILDICVQNYWVSEYDLPYILNEEEE